MAVNHPGEFFHLPSKKKRDWTQLFKGEFLILSIVVHLLFGIGAAYYVVQTFVPKEKIAFKAGSPVQQASQHAPNYKVQMEKRKNSISPVASHRVVTTGLSKVALPELPTMSSNDLSTPSSMGGMQTGGFGSGGQGNTMGIGGAGVAIPFFGLHLTTQSKRIAFLLDYSGSMEGPFRIKMENELRRALSALPAGSQILIIPWAGPAWLYNQRASQIAGKWKMIDGFDNFTLKPGEKLSSPKWISTSPGAIDEVMKQIHAQQSLPGGTDWRSPFRYVMEASPPPDVILFMTDGQVAARNVPRAMDAIQTALSKAPKTAQVNCLWIANKLNGPDAMKELAKKYHGDFVTVGSR